MRFFRGILIVLSLSLICSNPLDAQLCQGSLGDPLVNITFGAGTNPGPSLKAATTSYQYLANDCPGDGFYTVRNSSTNCFGNTWHSVPADHTGDPNGYFMLINASFQPSAFYLDTVKGLCGGTTYEFAAWIMNVLKTTACNPNPAQPNLTFTLEKTDGIVLQTYNTNTIVSLDNPFWQQFGFYFTTPVNVSDIVLRIFNNAPGGCGNDLALDDITFRPCGPKLTPSIVGSTSTTATICEGGARSFTFNCAVSAGFNNPSYQWQKSSDGIVWTDMPGATTTTVGQNFLTTTPVGNYLYRLSVAEVGNMNSPQCRIASEPLAIEVAANPVPIAVSNSPVCQNSSLQLNASGGSKYQWTGANNFSATGSAVSIKNIQAPQAGRYYVEVSTDAGCTKMDSVDVIVNIKPEANVSFSSTGICEGNSVQLVSSGGGTYQWAPATGLSSDIIANPVASPTTTTDYVVIVSNQFACKDTAMVSVTVIEAPGADAGPDKSIIEGNAVKLLANATGQNISYSWSPALFINDAQALQPMVNPPHDTIYVLSVVSNDGCGIATDSVKLKVYKDIFIPSAFSPNNDGLNDTWNIPVLNIFPGFELTIFNRQGQVVYQNKNSNIPWNGKYKGEPQPVGVYVYYIDLKIEGGQFKGTLTLIR
ncbi:MAG: gliding motility-associated C-terminal domain-containing protein [Chitinophagaceae bacterium]